MIGQSRTLLTMEERLRLAAQSQASSPEAAVRLVQRLSEIHPAFLFAGSADHDLMCGLTGEYWDLLEEDLLHYGSFCQSFRMAIEDDFRPPAGLGRRPDPLRPIWGTRVNNAVVLWGLMLLDHAKGRYWYKDIYHCTRMTLGQYLDALEALAFPRENMPGRRWRRWRAAFLNRYDRSAPLGDVLTDILRRYTAGWQEFGHVDQILRYMGALAYYQEELPEGPLPREETERVHRFREALHRYAPHLDGWELVEPDKWYPELWENYFTLAVRFPDSVPDPGDEAAPARAVRSQLYLSEWGFGPEVLRTLAALSPFPDFGALLEEHSSPKRLARAMEAVNDAVTELYMLWVEPYLRMEERRGDTFPF